MERNPIGGSDAISMAWELTEEGFGRCVGFSDGAAALLGYRAEEVINKTHTMEQLIEPEEFQYENLRAKRAYTEGVASGTRLGEYQKKTLVTKDGRHIRCAVCGEIATCVNGKTGRLGLAMLSTWEPMETP